jgi:hypothetical protein
MTKRNSGSFKCSALALLVMAPALAGCSMSDTTMDRFLVSPDKYANYNCAQIADEMTTATQRERELEGLMAQAGADSAGKLISGIAYDSDYASTRGELAELRKAWTAKKCVPTAGAADRRASDGFIR